MMLMASEILEMVMMMVENCLDHWMSQKSKEKRGDKERLVLRWKSGWNVSGLHKRKVYHTKKPKNKAEINVVGQKDNKEAAKMAKIYEERRCMCVLKAQCERKAYSTCFLTLNLTGLCFKIYFYCKYLHSP